MSILRRLAVMGLIFGPLAMFSALAEAHLLTSAAQYLAHPFTAVC
jgi:hypothetical protein